MKNTLVRITLAALAVVLLGSCEKINQRIDALEDRLDGIETEKIASIDSQIASINSSIADLGTIRSNITSLRSQVDDHSTDIFNLEEADRALNDRILNLEDYLDDVLPTYAEKDWVKATFSTLAQYEATCDTIAKIDARIGTLDAKLSNDIKACTDSLTKWVNKTFEGYYTAAQMDAKLTQMKSEIDSARAAGKVTDAKADSIAAELTKTKAAVDTAKANIRKEYRAAIDTAISGYEGRFTKKLQTSIDAVNDEIRVLAIRVVKLMSDVRTLNGRVDELMTRIQSVTIIPAFKDGSVRVENDTLHIDCEISPVSAVGALTRRNFKILVNQVVTKAVSVDTVRITSDTDFTKYKGTGRVSLKARVKEAYPTDIHKSITVALNVNNGISDYTTRFFTVSGTGVNLTEHSSISDAQEYVGQKDSYKSKEIDLTNVKILPTDVDGGDQTIHFILKTTSPPDKVSFVLPSIPEGIDATGWTIEYEDGYPTKDVEVAAPAGTNVTILAPTSHVVLNGETYNNIVAHTGYNTIVIPKGVTVENFTVRKGAVEIHGTVENLTIDPDPGENVWFRKCENLSTDVFARIKGNNGEEYNFIDPAFVEKRNQNGTYDIILKDDPLGFLPGEFNVGESKSVRFTKDNLSYAEGKFNIGSGQQGVSGTFFWSKDSGKAVAESYSDNDASTTDCLYTEKSSFNINGQGDIWHTLSEKEWKSLFENCNSAWSKVDGVDGIVIAPSKTGEIKKSYSRQEWEDAEAAGYVFLPVTNEAKDEILYWSSTPDGSDPTKARCVYLKKPESGSQVDVDNIIQSKDRSSKGAVRLVTYTSDPSVGIVIEKFTDGGTL